MEKIIIYYNFSIFLNLTLSTMIIYHSYLHYLLYHLFFLNLFKKIMVNYKIYIAQL